MTPAEKKRRKKAAAAAAAAEAAAAAARGSGSDSDLSTAALYEQIEVLQQRVTALHQRLGQPAPVMNGTIGNVTVVKAAPGAKPAASSKGGGGGVGGITRGGNDSSNHLSMKSRVDHYDINNVVGAVPTGAKFVERAQHVDICTPNVRAAATYVMAPITEERGMAAAAEAAAAAAAAITAGEG
jgi:hypothetical protein